jgi:hypothetical protein
MSALLAVAVPNWFIVALIVAAALSLLLVWFVRANFKINPVPCIVDLEDCVPGPDALQAALNVWESDITRLGYQRLGSVAVTDQVPGTSIVCVVYVHERELTHAWVSVIESCVKTQSGEKLITKKYLEFATELKDGTSVLTNNGIDVLLLPNGRDRTVHVVPELDAVSLHRVHRKVLSTREHPAPLRPEHTVPQMIEESSTKFIERGLRYGYMRRCGDGLVRFTWKGAIIGTLTNVPPMLQVWRWWGYRPGRALAKQVADMGLARS